LGVSFAETADDIIKVREFAEKKKKPVYVWWLNIGTRGVP
jgi:hypothetical protein